MSSGNTVERGIGLAGDCRAGGWGKSIREHVEKWNEKQRYRYMAMLRDEVAAVDVPKWANWDAFAQRW